MTDKQAKQKTLAILRRAMLRDIAAVVLDYVLKHLSATMPIAVNYFRAWGDLPTKRTARELRCELTAFLTREAIDPKPLIVRKSSRWRAQISYAGVGWRNLTSAELR